MNALTTTPTSPAKSNKPSAKRGRRSPTGGLQADGDSGWSLPAQAPAAPGRTRLPAPAPTLHDRPGSPAQPADQAWADLASQLTPAASLTRIDTVTARAITTITVLGTLLTGLGALTAGQLTHNAAARALATATVVTAAIAVTKPAQPSRLVATELFAYQYSRSCSGQP
jgi:hypothetical protein